MNMKIVIETVGPERAAELLKTNTSNYRKLNTRRVSAYASDMKNGKWEFNGEAIKISKSGVLKDGQHRLAAIVKSGVSVQMLIIYGVDDDITIYDVAQSRSCKQIAVASGFSKACSQHTTIGAAKLVASDYFGTVASPIGTIMDYIETHSETFETAYSISHVGSSSAIGKKSACIAAIYCLLRLGKDPELLSEFFKVVNTGFQSPTRDSSPAIVLRNTLLSPAKSTGINHSSSKTYLFSISLLAFHDFEAGKGRTKKYNPDLNYAASIVNKVRDLDERSSNIVELICG